MGLPSLSAVLPAYTRSTLRSSASPADDPHVRGDHRPSMPLGAAAEYDHSCQSQRPRPIVSHETRETRPVCNANARSPGARREDERLRAQTAIHRATLGPKTEAALRFAGASRRTSLQDRFVCWMSPSRGPASPSAGPNERRSARSSTSVTMSGRPAAREYRNQIPPDRRPECDITEATPARPMTLRRTG
jgi:hypothetical protein